jgi:hypothetical protein
MRNTRIGRCGDEALPETNGPIHERPSAWTCRRSRPAIAGGLSFNTTCAGLRDRERHLPETAFAPFTARNGGAVGSDLYSHVLELQRAEQCAREFAFCRVKFACPGPHQVADWHRRGKIEAPRQIVCPAHPYRCPRSRKFGMSAAAQLRRTRATSLAATMPMAVMTVTAVRVRVTLLVGAIGLRTLDTMTLTRRRHEPRTPQRDRQDGDERQSKAPRQPEHDIP